MSIFGFVFWYRKITVNRVYYVVFVLPVGLFFFFLAAVCMYVVYILCLVWSIWHLFVSEGAVCTLRV